MAQSNVEKLMAFGLPAGLATAINDIYLDTTSAQSYDGLQTYNDGLASDTIAEKTAAAGVTVDGTLLKDGGVTLGATGMLALSSTTTISAAGTTQGAATALTTGVNVVTTATASSADSVKLPTAAAGRVVIVHNGSSDTINIFPATGGAINGGSANAAVTLATTKARVFYAVSATAWYSLLGA